MDALFKAKRHPSTAKRKVRVYAWMNKLVKNSRQSKSLPLGGEGGPRGTKMERVVKSIRAARMR